MKGREQKEIYILWKEKRTPNPYFHFHDLSTLGYLASFEEMTNFFLETK